MQHILNKKTTIREYRAGNILEYVALEFKNNRSYIKKIDADTYLDLTTGKIENFKKSLNKSESTDNVRESINNLRRLINANVPEANYCKWICLTYKENMTDTKRLQTDLDAYNKRFKRFCERKGFDIPKYIAVVEPQGRGAWHAHILYIWKGRAPFFILEEFNELWQFGSTDLTEPYNVDDIGAYFSAYLMNLPEDELTEHELIRYSHLEKTTVNVKGKEKRFVKGARLNLYPSGMKIYRCSRGLIQPIITDLTIKQYNRRVNQIKKRAGLTQPAFESIKSFTVKTKSGEKDNTVYRVVYNLRKKK